VIGSAIAGSIEFLRLTLRTLFIDTCEEDVLVRDILGNDMRLPLPDSSSFARPPNVMTLDAFCFAPGRSSGWNTVSSFPSFDKMGEKDIPR